MVPHYQSHKFTMNCYNKVPWNYVGVMKLSHMLHFSMNDFLYVFKIKDMNFISYYSWINLFLFFSICFYWLYVLTFFRWDERPRVWCMSLDYEFGAWVWCMLISVFDLLSDSMILTKVKGPNNTLLCCGILSKLFDVI